MVEEFKELEMIMVGLNAQRKTVNVNNTEEWMKMKNMAKHAMEIAKKLLIEDGRINSKAEMYMYSNTDILLITEMRETKYFLSLKLDDVSIEFAILDD